MLNVALLAFEVSWDPGLRGILVVAVGVAVLMGSVYLLLATNMGSRLGFLVAVAGLSGWMALMGFVWAMYGIGYKGTAPSWKVEEVVTSDSASDLSAARLAKAHDLSKWRELSAEDPARGEAQALASAALAPAAGTDSRVAAFESDSEFKVIDAFTIGGKKISHGGSITDPFGDGGFKGFVNSWIPGPHPTHYSIVQAQAVVAVDVPFGETPPAAEIDKSAPVQSVILVRDLGKLRVPSVILMLVSLVIFGISCNVLHRRDKAAWAARAAAGV